MPTTLDSSLFDDAIADLQAVQTAAATIDGAALADAIAVVGDVIDVLSLADDIHDAYTLIVTAFDAINAVEDTLTAFLELVPGLDVVLDVLDALDTLVTGASDTLGPVLDGVVDVVDDLIPILRDIETGLEDVQALLATLSGDLPGIITTLQVLQALTSIAGALAGVFTTGDVNTRLQALLGVYDAVRTTVAPLASALSELFGDFAPAFSAVSDGLNAIKRALGTGFSDMETAFDWAAQTMHTLMSDADSIAQALGPVKWVLSAASSVESKVLGPIISRLDHAIGLDHLDKLLSAKITDALGFGALTTFNGTSGSQSSVTGAQTSTGSQGASSMRTAYSQLTQAAAAYQRGDNQTAVADAVSALLTALTGGTVDLQAPAPNLPDNPPSFDVPPLPAPLPPALGTATTRRRPRARLATRPTRDVARLGATIAAARADVTQPADRAAVAALTTAVTSQATALSAACAQLAPTDAALIAIPALSTAPADANQQFTVLAAIVQALADTLSTISTLYPTAVSGLQPYLTQLADLGTSLGAIAVSASQVAPLATALDQVATAAIQALPSSLALTTAEANINAYVSAAGTTIELLAQLDQLAQGQPPSLQTQVAGVHTQFDASATTVTSSVDTLATPVGAIATALADLYASAIAAENLLVPIAAHATPVVARWLPALQQLYRCATALDSILDPVSYLLELGGCSGDARAAATPSWTAEALLLADAIGKLALNAVSDVLAGLPSWLEQLLADGLAVPTLSAALSTALAQLPAATAAISSATTALGDNVPLVRSAAQPAQSYPVVDPTTGDTLTISNAFFSATQVQAMTMLINELLGNALAAARPLPDASALIQSWRTS